MARWEPNAIGRLQEAALLLFRERGYDETTVAEIAERAGLTPRTFFRYFADKREVLFSGAAGLEAFLSEHIAAAPASTAAIDTVIEAFEAVARASAESADFFRRRQLLIQEHSELRERDLIKHASLAASTAAALRTRGVHEPAASLAAQAAIAAFQIAFDRWATDAKRQTLAHHLREASRALSSVVSGDVVLKGKPREPMSTP